MKKKTLRKKLGVRHYTVGNWFAKRRIYRIDRVSSLTPGGRTLLERGTEGGNPFDASLAPPEASARKILEQAGLPTDPSGFYTIPEGEKIPMPQTKEEVQAILSRSSEQKGGGLRELVKVRGYRRRIDQEWYAAEILTLAQMVRAVNLQGDHWTALYLAAQTGGLIREAEARGYFSQTGARNEGTKKTLPPTGDLARFLFRKNKGATAREFWNMIPTNQDDGIKINGYKFYRHGKRLRALRKGEDGNWRPAGKTLEFPTFKNHITKARKPLPR